MKKALLFTVLFSAALILPAKELLREYPLMRQVKLTGTPGEAASIRLDPELFKNTNADYSNILLLDKTGKPVPYAVMNAGTKTTQYNYHPLTGKISGFSRDTKRNIAEATFTFTKPEEVSRLLFETNQERFQKKIQLQFFDESGKLIREDKDLQLFQYGKIFGNSVVDFKETKAKSIRIIIHNFAEQKESSYRTESTGTAGRSVQKVLRTEEFDLRGIKAYRKEASVQFSEWKPRPVDLPEVSRQNKGNVTEILVDAHRVPAQGLIIRSDDRHFSRKMEIFSRSGKTETLIGSGTLTPEAKMIPLKEMRGDFYLIRISNASNEPLKNIRLEWFSKEKYLIFQPPACGGDLTLYYGGKPDRQLYDIEHYAEKFGLPEQVYQLGEASDSPDYAPALPADEIYQYFMWGILGIAAVFLLILIIRFWNGKKLPDEESGE